MAYASLLQAPTTGPTGGTSRDQNPMEADTRAEAPGFSGPGYHLGVKEGWNAPAMRRLNTKQEPVVQYLSFHTGNNGRYAMVQTFLLQPVGEQFPVELARYPFRVYVYHGKSEKILGSADFMARAWSWPAIRKELWASIEFLPIPGLQTLRDPE